MEINSTVKNRCRLIRKAVGLNQSQLADLADVHPSKVSDWEREGSDKPKRLDRVREPLLRALESIAKGQYGRRLDPSSPILQELDLLRSAVLLLGAESPLASQRWKVVETCLCVLSKRPWERSALLAGEVEVAPDIKNHGMACAQELMRRRIAHLNQQKDEHRGICHRAMLRLFLSPDEIDRLKAENPDRESYGLAFAGMILGKFRTGDGYDRERFRLFEAVTSRMGYGSGKIEGAWEEYHG